MDKQYLYIGLLVDFETYVCIVTNIEGNNITLMNIKTYEVYTNINASEIHNFYHPTDEIKEYNKKIREINSVRTKSLKNAMLKYSFNDGSKVWFTSDTHFSHENIIKFIGRPFKSVEEMNDYLVEAWNLLIGEDDTVFHLGDFCFGSSSQWNNILSRLNGHIHLIIGNHDVKNLKEGYMKHFESVSYQMKIEVEGRKIYLNHYPFLTYAGIYRKDKDIVWQLFGHVHSQNNQGGADTCRLAYKLPTQYDVGVDNNSYKPINFNTVKLYIEQQLKEANENKKKCDLALNQTIEHLTLKNNILINMLTDKQYEDYIALTTDKEEEDN